MNVLVTGGAGYIGSHTVVELIKSGHKAIIVDDLSNAKANVVDRIETITGVRPDFYELDCKNAEGLREVFGAHKIDAIIHFAAFKAVGESVQKPLQYYRNNIDSTLTLLEVMEEFDCKKFIHLQRRFTDQTIRIHTKKKCQQSSLPVHMDGQKL